MTKTVHPLADSMPKHTAPFFSGLQAVLESVLGKDLVRSGGVTLQRLLAVRNSATRCVGMACAACSWRPGRA